MYTKLNLRPQLKYIKVKEIKIIKQKIDLKLKLLNTIEGADNKMTTFVYLSQVLNEGLVSLYIYMTALV